MRQEPTPEELERYKKWLTLRPQERENPEFDPKGTGYDEDLGSQLRALHPLTIPKPTSFQGEYISEPESFEAWVWHPELNDYVKHSGSLDPSTGMVLKGLQHPTFYKTTQTEGARGSAITKGEDDRYYSQDPTFPPSYVPPTSGMPEPEWLRTTGEVMGAIIGAPVKFAIALPGAVVSSINNAWNLYAHVVAGGKFKDPETGRELSYTQAMDPKEASETLRTSIGMANLDLATVPFGGGAASAGEGLASGPKFYSPLERALESGKVGKLTIPDNPKATGMLSTFKYATDKNLINMEELEYTGLLQKLKSLGDARISRDEMLELVKSKSLKETGTPEVLGGQSKIDYALDRMEGMLDETPNANIRRGEAIVHGIDRLRERRGVSGDPMISRYGPDSHGAFNLQGSIPNTYQERLFHFTPEGGLRYVEPHDWPGNVAENAFMFTRGHDRKLPNGEVSKHLDEMQSSLHQKAMEEGYTDPRILERATAIQNELIKNEKDRVAFLHSKDWTYTVPTKEQKDYLNSFHNRDTALRNELLDIKQNRSKIPPAPFKDLKWAKLGLKEWVDTAIKEGKDSVTWSTGRIVADRYNKLANSFNWNKDLKTGKYTLHFETPSGRTFDQGYVNMKQLQDNAGKNVARIVAEQEKKTELPNRQRFIVKTIGKGDEAVYHVIDTTDNTLVTPYLDESMAKRKAESENYAIRAIYGDGATGDFLVGGKFFEKVYDEYMVREAEKEYGVRPQLIKAEIVAPQYKRIWYEEDSSGIKGYNVMGETQDGVIVQLSDYIDTPIHALEIVNIYKKKGAIGDTTEIWHLPLSQDLKQRITIEGQRIAQGSLTTAQALKALAQRDTNDTHDSRPPVERGQASWYGPGFHGKKMSNKKPFDMNKMTAAHRKLPFGTKVKATDTDTGKSVVVEITDRGPYVDGRILDLSKKAAEKLGSKKKGLANIKLEIIEKAKEQPPHIQIGER